MTSQPDLSRVGITKPSFYSSGNIVQPLRTAPATLIQSYYSENEARHVAPL